MASIIPDMSNIYPKTVRNIVAENPIRNPPPTIIPNPPQQNIRAMIVAFVLRFIFIPTLYYAFSLLSIVNLSNLLLAATAYMSVRS